MPAWRAFHSHALIDEKRKERPTHRDDAGIKTGGYGIAGQRRYGDTRIAVTDKVVICRGDCNDAGYPKQKYQ